MPSQRDDFAVLLRSLKERSGRSYEALGRRVGVSSSALHRYCSGHTVPTDYDVIDRLGRVCHLSRDELLELHRRWALASADRQPPAADPAAATGLPAGTDRPGGTDQRGGASGAAGPPRGRVVLIAAAATIAVAAACLRWLPGRTRADVSCRAGTG